MAKFELTRKYLVGFLAAAVLLMTFAMPLAPTSAAELNASVWAVEVTPATATNPTYSPTHVVTIETYLVSGPNRTLATPTETVRVALGQAAIITDPIPTSLTSTGVYTATVVYGVDTPLTPSTYKIYGYIDTDGTGYLDSTDDVVSDPAFKTWEDPVPTNIYAEPATETNTVTWTDTTPSGSHTVTITVKDQFGFPMKDVTVNVGVTGVSPTTGVTTTNTDGVGTFGYPFNSSATPTSQGLYGDDAITATASGTSTSTTAAKTWTYTPTPSNGSITPSTATNVVGETHTVTVAWVDQYNYPLSWHFTIDWSVNSVTATPNLATHTGTAASDAFTFTNTKVEVNTITASIFLDGAPMSVPMTATKAWTVDTGYILTLAPETATNLVGTTHTVNANLTDKFGNPVTTTTIDFSVDPTTQVSPSTGSVATDGSGNASFTFTSTKNQTTVITASALGATATATKVWTPGHPSQDGSGWVTPLGTVATATWYNMVTDVHTATVFVGDQYGNLPDPLPTYVDYTITSSTGDTTPTGTVSVDPTTGIAVISWTRSVAGIDEIVVKIPANGQDELTIATGTKWWSNEWNVGPLEEINAIGTEHQFVVKGYPGEHIVWRLYQNDHGLIQIRNIQAHDYAITSPYEEDRAPTGFHDSFTGTAELDPTGSATFTVYSKAPFKYYFETDFNADLVDGAQLNANRDPFSAVRHITQTHWEVAKIYAVLTRSEIGPITQDNDITGTKDDHHTVTATVYGKYYWYGAWSAEVPVQNARVDWTVTYTDSFDRDFVACTVDPGGNPTQDTPGSLKATSFTNALGVATFTYSLDIGSSLLIPSPLHDHITAYDHYTEAVLDLDYPPPPLQEAEKYWYDHPFKLVKHVAGDRNQVIPNVEFFLKTGTDTYFHNGWAHLVVDSYLVKTDTYGAALWYHLPAGAYTIYEKTPTGYIGGGTTQAVGTFSVPGDTGIYTGVIYTRYIPNTPTTPTGCIQLTKRANSFTGTLMADVDFEVYTSTGTFVSNYTSDASGVAKFCPLPASWTATTWYRVHEEVPSGYLPVSDFWFYFPPGVTTGVGFFKSMSPTDWASDFVERTLINRTPTTPTGWTHLTKVSDTSSPLVDVHFDVSTSGGTPVGTFSTDAGGDVTFGPLTASQTDTTWYKVHETVPTGYLPVSDFWFFLPPGGGEGTGFFATEGATVPLFTKTLTNYHIPVTPTGTTVLSKLTYCFLHLGGASFRVTDTATPANTWVFGPTDAITGQLTLGPVPAPRAESWYLVHEEVTPAGYLPVADFYFFLPGDTGIWNGHYYVSASTAAAEVWPLAAHPTDPTEPPAHWVVDQQNPAVPISLDNLAATPTSNVSFWRPVTISANSPAVGQWSGKIFTPDGVEIGTLPGSEGLAFSAAWVPSPNAYPVGSYYAVVQLTDGAAVTLTNTVFFNVYNYEVKILSVSFLDGGLQPIVNPIANLPFYVKAEIQNVQTGTVTTAFIPVMIGATYIGAGGVGGLLRGQVMQTYIYSPMGLAAGTYTGHAYVWVSTILPTPLSLPFDFTVTVVSAP